MNTWCRVSIRALCCALLVSAGLAVAGGNKTVINIENKAKSNGELSFEFTPAGGKTVVVKIGVIAKMKPTDIARDVMKEFTLAIGEGYKVKMKDPQKVAVESPNKDSTFEIKLAGNTVQGLSVLVK